MSGATTVVTRRRRLPVAATLAVSYFVAVVASVAFTTLLGDRHWLATALLFAPRWVHALPLPLVLLLVFFARGRARAVAFGSVVGAAFLLLRFNDVHLPLPAGTPAEPTLRVLSYNVGGGEYESSALADIVAEADADVAGMQECGDLEEEPFVAKGYTVRREANSICLVTRLPIRAEDIRDSHWVEGVSAAGHISRYELEHAGRVFSVVLVHLHTVREGLDALRSGLRGPNWRGPEVMRANISQRSAESRLALEWTKRGASPVIVMGDFNIPADSAIFREYWSGFHNALGERGAGHLVTKRTRVHGVRIDHVLFDDAFTCGRAWIARDLGLDHRPVVAELGWAQR